LPKDHLYVQNSIITGDQVMSSDNDKMLALQDTIVGMKNVTNTYGFGTIYGYGVDEPTYAQSLLERTSFAVARGNGTKTDFPTSDQTVIQLADRTDLVNLANAYSTANLNAWKAANPTIRVLTYANPQMGAADPEVYRQQYGFALWRSGYDGAMDFAYQAEYGQSIWNDYDSPVYGGIYYYQDFAAAYPKTDGVIDTIQWEGYREGVDDSRYADELTRITGNRTEATAIINAGLADGSDMSVIRGTIIDHILAYGDTVHPVANFTTNVTLGVVPLVVAFNDTSSGSPTTWNWSFGDGNWTNGTTQNVTHLYEAIGTYNSFLIASNVAGSNQSANHTITATSAAITPVAAFTAVASGSTVTFTDQSTYSPTSWTWQYNQHEAPGWVEFSTSQNPSYNFVEGTYDINLTATNAAGSDSEVKTSFIVVSSGGESETFPDAPATEYQEAHARYATSNDGMITAMILIFLVAAIVGVAIAIKCIREGITDATFPLIVGYFIGVFVLVIVFAAIPAFAYIGEV
jgi:PKD repeat protein